MDLSIAGRAHCMKKQSHAGKPPRQNTRPAALLPPSISLVFFFPPSSLSHPQMVIHCIRPESIKSSPIPHHYEKQTHTHEINEAQLERTHIGAALARQRLCMRRHSATRLVRSAYMSASAGGGRPHSVRCRRSVSVLFLVLYHLLNQTSTQASTQRVSTPALPPEQSIKEKKHID